jgi:uncharacterized protein involved in outer membrane biogenesis
MKLGKILKILGALVVALVVGLAVAIMSIDLNSMKQTLTAEVSRITGRELVISGDLGLAVGLTPALTADGVRFANAEWAGPEPMATVTHLEAQVGLMPLLSGVIEVHKVVLEGARIRLATNAEGQGNWTLPALASTGEAEATSKEDAGEGTMPVLDVRAVTLKDVVISYLDGQAGGEATEVNLKSLSVTAEGVDQALNVAAEAGLLGNTFGLSGTVGNLNDILAGKPMPLNLTLSMANASGAEALAGTVVGSLAEPMAGQGVVARYTLRVPDPSRLAEGIPLTQALDMSGQVTQDGSAWKVDDIALGLGATSMTGGLRFDPGEKTPVLSGKLHFPLLALDELVPAGEGEEEPTTASKTVIPDTEFDLSALRTLPLSLSLPVTADQVRLPQAGLVLDDVALDLKLKPGTVGPVAYAATVAKGRVQGEVTVVVGKDGPPTLALKTTTKGVVVGDLLAILAGGNTPLTGGPTDMTLDLKGSGSSPHAIAASLNGSILVTMGEGTINSALVDLAGGDLMSQFGDLIGGSSTKGTALNCAVINVTAKKGVIQWDRKVAAETNRMTVASTGAISLGDETMDLGIKPRAREGIGLEAGVGRVTQLVRVKGTFAKPEVDLDIASAVLEGVGAVANIGAAAATLGGSLALEDMTSSLLGVEEDDTAPCATARGEKAPPKATKAKSTESVADKAKKAVDDVVKGVTGGGSVEKTTKGALDTVKKGLGGLLGN